MGQKVSPHGLRVGVIKDWDSKWFADKSKFADFLVEDNQLREFVKKKLYAAGVSKVVIERAADNKVKVVCYQSNYEGDLVTQIQKCLGKFDGIVINPGAYTHTSIAILDAAKAVKIPVVEVHISKVEEREDFRQVSYIRNACVKTITGHGIQGYIEALDFLKNDYKNNAARAGDK